MLGTPAPGNSPPGRWYASNWTDKNGNLWLFGGQGYDAVSNATGVPLDDLWEFNLSLNQWAWMGGSDTVHHYCNNNGAYGWPGVYGTVGMPAAGNIPGSRSGAASWVDNDGNFWLFGGAGCDANGNPGTLNDLWEYSPAINEWTWMGGSSTVGTYDGQPGVYGTLGTPALGNIPGGRTDAASWTDRDGNFWVFGGSGYDANDVAGWLDDLWEFDPSAKEWTWMGGSHAVPKSGGGQSGVYGTLGTPAPGNIPGGRLGSMTWTDSDDNLWLFGGSGYDEDGNPTDLNDLWRFAPSTQLWTWMGGSATSTGCTTYQLGLVICAGQSGVYGTLGTPASGNVPGGRVGAASWVDGNGNFWLFGGQGYDSAGNDGSLNDLWEFDPSANEWTWMDGNATESGCEVAPEGNTFCNGQPGEYGTLDVPGPGDDPGTRLGASSWTDQTGNLWLFGGYGVGDSTGNGMGVLNDLWEYQQSTTALPPAAAPAFSPASGTYSSNQTVTISDATPGATIYYTTDGSAPTTESTIYSGPVAITSPGGTFTETIEAIATADGYSPSTMTSATYTINLPPNFSVATSPDSLTVPAGQNGQVTISVTPVNGFNSAVSFSCSGLPSGASCSFSPASVTPQGAPASTTLTLTTSTAAAANHGSSPLLPTMAFMAVLCCIRWKGRRPMRLMLALFAVCSLGLSLLCGCGGGSSKSQSATVTVTAVSGSLQNSTSFKLTVD
ncbi:MAG: kelch repeat-containing protein [Terracidiphilus sp.]